MAWTGQSVPRVVVDQRRELPPLPTLAGAQRNTIQPAMYTFELTLCARYYSRSSRSLIHKLGVACLIVADTVCVFATGVNTCFTVTGASMRNLNLFAAPVATQIMSTYTSAVVAQLFFCHIFYTLTRNWLISGLLILLIFVHDRRHLVCGHRFHPRRMPGLKVLENDVRHNPRPHDPEGRVYALAILANFLLALPRRWDEQRASRRLDTTLSHSVVFQLPNSSRAAKKGDGGLTKIIGRDPYIWMTSISFHRMSLRRESRIARQLQAFWSPTTLKLGTSVPYCLAVASTFDSIGWLRYWIAHDQKNIASSESSGGRYLYL
ncbi:hypothetical protein C8R45DRAFT_945734 [Mycena sanguinolenta]|nr:hypothetical protein C8R45DRAFT_945734 [Mycena sanguinolenta]